MSNTPNSPNQRYNRPEKLQDEIRQAGLIVGLQGLEVVVTPGAGWSCAATKQGITITADPDQLTERRSPTGDATDSIDKDFSTKYSEHIKGEHIIHTIFHELGHAKDFMDPEYTKTSNNEAERFFYNIIDDSAVDSHNRKIPLVNNATASIYENVLFPVNDLTSEPKHVQLMYGVLLMTVTPDRDILVSEEIGTILASFKDFSRHGQSYSLPEIIADPRTTLPQRNFIAKNFIKPYFDTLLEQDKQDNGSDTGSAGEQFETIYSDYDLAAHGHGHDDPTQDNPHAGNSSIGTLDTDVNEDLATQLAKALKQIQSPEDKPAQSTTQNYPNNEGSKNKPQVSQSTILSLASGISQEMSLKINDANRYATSVDRWQDTIRAISDVFLKLASPTSAILSPRYRREASTEGLRLHPATLAKAVIQLETNINQSIWQKTERRARRQELAFGGIDIHLLVDVSASMNYDNKAQYAADTALCLMEGLQLAKHKVSKANGQFHQPDVRTQIIAFGSDTKILSPISPQPNDEQKGKTYTNLINPESVSTLVADALLQVNSTVSASPSRETIVIIISDGAFHDHDKAKQIVASMPDNCYVSQLVIGNKVQQYISNTHENVTDPLSLPPKLLKILDKRIK